MEKTKFEKGEKVIHRSLGEGVFVDYDLHDGEVVVEFTDEYGYTDEFRVSEHLLQSKNEFTEVIKKGDIVAFTIGKDPHRYKVLTDEHLFSGERVVDLIGYSGEVSVKYLKIIERNNLPLNPCKDCGKEERNPGVSVCGSCYDKNCNEVIRILKGRNGLENGVELKTDLLKEINEWVQKGYDIRYLITNQMDNGYEAEVLAGNMPKFTYSFFIDEKQEMIWDFSVDTLEEGFSMALKWLKNNRKFSKQMKVKPLTGFWKGTVGVIVDISPSPFNEYPISVEFEENETNNYNEEQLEIV